jgi:arginyl-tRNA synthetase
MSSLSVYARYTHAFAGALASALSVSKDEILPQIKPAEAAHGDLSFATFSLAKSQRKAPPAIAAGLAQSIRVPGLTLQAVGPYLNARFELMPFTQEVIDAARTQSSAYGSSSLGAGKTVVIDYSSPNIAKPIGFHHIRSTMIGHSLANLYRSQGYRVEGINYLGDWGKQFGLVAVGLQEYGDPSRRREMAHWVEVYVKANARADSDSAFDDRAKDFFRRMEQGDAEALALWEEVRSLSLEDFKKLYARLGISFEHYEGESRYQGKMEAVIAEIAKTVGVRDSQGALIADMVYPEGEPPVLLKKNDGSTLYATRDIAAALDRFERFHFDKSLYVVGAAQTLHFRQIFRVLEKMGKAWAAECVHVPFGLVHGMSTRKGQVVKLSDVLDEARSRALEKVLENQSSGRIQTDNAEALAEQVGIGAIVFGDLKNRRISDYTFDWEEVLNFEGHTGPYLMYAHARACNVMQKAGGAASTYDASLLTLSEEQALVREIARLPTAISDAIAHNEPSMVARLLLDVASAFSRWYTLGNQDRAKRILVDGNDALKASRLALTQAVRHTLSSGLTLLGVPTPEQM